MKKVRLSNSQTGISLLATHIHNKIKKELELSYPEIVSLTWEITLKVKE